MLLNLIKILSYFSDLVSEVDIWNDSLEKHPIGCPSSPVKVKRRAPPKPPPYYDKISSSKPIVPPPDPSLAAEEVGFYDSITSKEHKISAANNSVYESVASQPRRRIGEPLLLILRSLILPI